MYGQLFKIVDCSSEFGPLSLKVLHYCDDWTCKMWSRNGSLVSLSLCAIMMWEYWSSKYWKLFKIVNWSSEVGPLSFWKICTTVMIRKTKRWKQLKLA
jgi:hypothetical protein